MKGIGDPLGGSGLPIAAEAASVTLWGLKHP